MLVQRNSWLAACFLAAGLLPGGAEAGTPGGGTSGPRVSSPFAGNLLDNPSFERGKKRPESWVTSVPLAAATSKPRFGFSEIEVPAGKRSATVRADFRGGFTAYAQVLRVPPRARSFRLEGLARLENVTYEGGARLAVTFVGSKLEGGAVTTESRLLRGVADWTILSLDAAIPEGTKSIEVRCGVMGPCMAAFDSLVATASDEEAHHVSFSTFHSDYTVRLPANAADSMREPFVRLPLPLADVGQRPIAIRVNARPEEAVAALSYFQQGENRMLEIRLQPLFPNDEVKLRVESLVLIDAAAPWGESTIRIPRNAEMDEGLRELLGSSPGIDPGHGLVREALAEAKREVNGSDVPWAVEVVRLALAAKLKVRAPEPDLPDKRYEEGVEACLTAGTAGPTGFANTAVSCLRALGLPARLVYATRVGDEEDARYFADLWTPLVGWTRMDPMSGEWPVARTETVAHRVIDPVTIRPFGAVPYDPMIAAEGLRLEVRRDRLGRASTFRPAEPVVIRSGGLGALTRRVEESYRSLLTEPLDGSLWLPVAGSQEADQVIDGAIAAQEALQFWLELPRLVGN